MPIFQDLKCVRCYVFSAENINTDKISPKNDETF